MSINKRDPLALEMVFKPIIAGLTVFVLDRFILKNTNLRSGLLFSGAMAGGVMISSGIAASVDAVNLDEKIPSALGKSLQKRVIEISLGTVSIYALNHYMLQNRDDDGGWVKRLLVIAAADMISETITQSIILS